jgi:hypothetical protein
MQKSHQPNTKGSYVEDHGDCPVTAKVRFVTRKGAKQTLRAMLARGKSISGMAVYVCPHCGDFHIGHDAGLSRERHREFHTMPHC